MADGCINLCPSHASVWSMARWSKASSLLGRSDSFSHYVYTVLLQTYVGLALGSFTVLRPGTACTKQPCANLCRPSFNASLQPAAASVLILPNLRKPASTKKSTPPLHIPSS